MTICLIEIKPFCIKCDVFFFYYFSFLFLYILFCVLFAVGGEVHDRGGSDGSVPQQSSGAGERRQIQGGRAVNGDHFIYSNLSPHWLLEAQRMERGRLTWRCWRLSRTSATARKIINTVLGCWQVVSFHYVKTGSPFESLLWLFLTLKH